MLDGYFQLSKLRVLKLIGMADRIEFAPVQFAAAIFSATSSSSIWRIAWVSLLAVPSILPPVFCLPFLNGILSSFQSRNDTRVRPCSSVVSPTVIGVGDDAAMIGNGPGSVPIPVVTAIIAVIVVP